MTSQIVESSVERELSSVANSLVMWCETQRSREVNSNNKNQTA